MKKTINSKKLPKAVGPYSHAVKCGDLIFLSGQIPMDAHTGELIKGDITEQTKKVLDNIKDFLFERNLDFNSIVKMTIFIRNMNDFAAINEVYAGYFKEEFPARAVVEVSGLPKNVSIEMEAVIYEKA